MKAYRRKPVIIDAVQFEPTVKPWPECIVPWTEVRPRDMSFGYIETLQGKGHIWAGDWVIKGPTGEFYPCKPHIFEATYEAVDAAT